MKLKIYEKRLLFWLKNNFEFEYLNLVNFN